MTTSFRSQLDKIRSEFPRWVLWRSDTGAYYATRRGVTLTWQQINEGLQQTVGADDLPGLIEALREQEGIK